MSRLQREYPVATAPGSDLVAKRYSISRLRRDDGVEEKFFWDDLSNSGPAVRLYGEGRAIGPPKD
jgi:hypothetical protein